MVINIDNLKVVYGKNVILNDFSLKVEEGEVIGLLGPNGAGKTTLMNSILGIKKIQEGTVEIFDKDVKKFEKEVKKYIGYVPQDIALVEELSVYDNVALFTKLNGLRGKEAQDKIQEVLEFAELWDRRKAYPKQLSGGMQRRLNIACSIANNPKLLFMDEPAVGVDPQSRNKILSMVKQINQEGTTVIYSSHYMEEIEEVCNRVIIMDEGKIIADGSCEQIKDLVIKELAIHFELSEKSTKLLQEIEKIEGVCRIEDKEDGLNVIIKRESNCLETIMKVIFDNNIGIYNVSCDKSNLETAFLTLTGKKLRE